MASFDFTGATGTLLSAVDAGWNGDTNQLELDGSGNLRSTISSGESSVWYTGAQNNVTIVEGPTTGSDLMGPAIHVGSNQLGYHCEVNYSFADPNTIVDVRMYRNDVLWGTNIVPSIDRSSGPMTVQLYLYNGTTPTVVLNNGVQSETLTWAEDPSPLTTGNGGLYLNPNFQAPLTLVSSWADADIPTVAFKVTDISPLTPTQGDTLVVSFDGGDGTATWELGNVLITPEAQTSTSATFTVPDFSADGGTRPWDTPVTLRGTQGGEVSDFQIPAVSSPANQVFTVAGYTHVFDGPSIFDAATGNPANNISNGDQAEVNVTAGALVVNAAGVPTSATLPATFDLRVFDASAGSWTLIGEGTLIEQAQDLTPTPFSFSAVTNADVSTLVESNTVTITGINADVTASVTSGEHRVNGGTWTVAPATVSNGDTYQVRLTTSSSNGVETTLTATIGTVSEVFSVTTLAATAVPVPFTFTPAENVPVNTEHSTSNTIVIQGINTTVPVTISGSPSAQYSKNGGAWTSEPGVATLNDTFAVRVNASPNHLTQTSAALIVGTVTAVYTVTTPPASASIPADKIELEAVQSGFETVTLINNNQSKIEDEFNYKVLYRNNPEGKANFMSNDLDMNSNRIFNLPDAVDLQEPITLSQASLLAGDSNPIYGVVDGNAIWSRSKNNGPWVPAATFKDITVRFLRASATIATHKIQVVLNSGTGALSVVTTATTGTPTTLTVTNNNTINPTISVTEVQSGTTIGVLAISTQSGADGAAGATGTVPAIYYIKPVSGTAIKNSVGTITVEARQIINGVDTLVSSGAAKLYVGATEVTTANGYATGSDGYTGVFDSGDINDSVVVELKSGSGGTPYDTITLVDVVDGVASNATVGSIDPSNGLGWTRAPNLGAWSPAQAYTDLVCTFYQGGSAIATETRRVTLNETTGVLTEALQGTDNADIDVSNTGASSTAITVVFTHVPSGVKVAETVLSVAGGEAGDDGASGTDGADGADGADAELYYIKPIDGTAIKNGSGTLTVEARYLNGTSNTLLSSGTIQLYVGTTLVSAANGYVAGSDGYTGEFDSTDINGSVLVELKDGPSGTVYDTITLIDVEDGVASNATTGSINVDNTLTWVQAPNAGAWSPATADTTLTVDFFQSGASVASEDWDVTLNTGTGDLTAAINGASSADITETIIGNGSSSVTIEFLHTPSGTRVAETFAAVRGGADGADAVYRYIRPVTGTALKNSTGTLEIEARQVQGGVDTAITSGSYQLYVGSTLVSTANGYSAGSNGYTGVFGSGDITDSVLVQLKAGASAEPVDTITLIDVVDGTGISAVAGSIEASNGLSFARAKNNGAWSPSQNTTDLVCTFYQGGSQIAQETQRVTLNTSTGTLTSALTGSNNGNISVSVTGNTTSALTVEFTHVPSGVRVSEGVAAVQSGTDGTDGTDGEDAEFIYTTGTSVTLASAPTPRSLTGTLAIVKRFQLAGTGSVTVTYRASGGNLVQGQLEFRQGSTVLATATPVVTASLATYTLTVPLNNKNDTLDLYGRTTGGSFVIRDVVVSAGAIGGEQTVQD